MQFKNTPIRRKLMTVNLLTSGMVLLLACSGFIGYEFITLHRNMVQGYTSRAEILAANLVAARVFQNEGAADDVLNALKNDPRIMASCIYDPAGGIFAKYPSNAPVGKYPAAPGKSGYRSGSLEIFCPIVRDGQSFGTLYLQSNLSPLTDRYRAYAWLVAGIIAGSIWVAYLFSLTLQKRISAPILALAESASAVFRRGDYSVRAQKFGDDELGLLTDAFNQMLAQIKQQTDSLVESEARVRAVVDSAIIAVVVFDARDKIADWNVRAETMLGWTHAEALGRGFAETVLPARHREAHQRSLRQFLDGGESPVWRGLGELSASRRDGSEFPVELSIGPMKAGSAVTFCGFITDITERQRAEQEIHRLNTELEHRVVQRTAELEAANKELEAFSYSVSHDLRAPLRAVNGFAGIVLEEFGAQLPEEGQRYLGRIRAGGQRMGELIDDLLKFSRFSRQIVNRQAVDQFTLVQNILEEFKPQREGRRIEIKVGELPEGVGDPALLKQVWINLISNAVKYTRGREPALVEIGCARGNGGNIYFVRDNGAGFDMRYANKLFGVFHRLHREDEFEGTGVGLAIVQRIIHRHGGRVWAEAVPGKGATFHFTLEGQGPPESK